jgi:urease accessory protein
MDSSRAVVRNVTAVDQREAVAIGRRARLELEFACRQGRTVLTHAYAEPPCRVGCSLDAGPYTYVMLVCSGPGVFGGDAIDQRVHVGRGARVLLVSQAALQIHPTAAAGSHDAAVIQSRFEVESGGELDCFWDPVIPFAGARLAQRIDVHLATDSRLFWSDALMAGRIGRGEAWRFDEVSHELRVNVGGRLRYLERYRLTPQSRPVERRWMAGGAHYLGTTLVHDEGATAACAERLQMRLGTIDGIHAGVDVVSPNLLVARLLAARGPQFAAAREALRSALDRPPLRRV